MSHVLRLYPFVTYLLTLPRTLLISVTYIHVYIRIILNWNDTFVMLFCLKYSMSNSVYKYWRFYIQFIIFVSMKAESKP
jgi:hypothetical protein